MKKVLMLIVVTVIILGALILMQKKHQATTSMVGGNQMALSAHPSGIEPTALPSSSPTNEVVQANEITLSVTSPTNNQTVTTPNLMVQGKTVPNADVLVNDTELKADANGVFSSSVILDPGQNIITVTANDDAGNYAEQDITVTLQQ